MAIHKFSIVVCARWECAYIIEWINYQRCLGFDHIYLYCNDDDPSELYEKVLPFTQGKHPFVSFRYFPDQGKQLEMYAHFLEHDRGETEWVSFLDVDEFMRLPAGTSLPEFIAHFENIADCVMFNWIFFGPNGHRTPPEIPVLSAFTKRQAAIHPFTKYAVRSSCLSGAKFFDPTLGHGFWHSPLKQAETTIRAINVLGEDMSTYYDGFPDKPTAFVNDAKRKDQILSTAIVHHYAFRSEQAFHDRVRRGLKGAFNGQTIWGNLADSAKFPTFLASINEVEDLRLATFWPSLLQKANETNILTAPDPALISYRKNATQSTLSRWSVGATLEQDACGAVNGLVDGRHKFHTEIEDAPWWMVDLDGTFGIDEIRIFNRTDQDGVRERASRLKIEIGLDPDHLVEFYRKENDIVFGGIDGTPLIWKPSIPAVGRFVRITLLTRDYLHLDQVMVFGTRLGDSFGRIAAE